MVSSNVKDTVEKPHNNTFPGDNTSISSASAASSICQGLKFCLEPLLSDPMCVRVPTERASSPLLPRKQAEAPRGGCSKHGPIAAACRNGEDSAGRWASVESLTSRGKLADGEGDQIYIHPLVSRAVSSLSMESLEMCTESLGSETGSSIIELGIDEFSSHQERPGGATRTPKTGVSCRKAKQGSSFPPPLTSIGGSDGLKVHTRREAGRLVIKAFALPCISPYFQAKRENGRLRLHLIKEGCLNGDGPEDGEEKDTLGDRDRAENDGNEDEFDAGFWEGKVGCKVGNGEWSGSSRCSGRKRLPSLPICVAIS